MSNLGAERPISQTALLAFSIFVVCTLVYWGMYRSYIFSDFLYYDDNIYLSRSVNDVPLLPLAGIGGYVLIAALGKFGALWVIKAASALFFPTAALLAFLVLRRSGVPRLLAAAGAVLVLTFPADITQAFFVSGAHPLMGTAWALAATLCFLLALYASPARFYGQMLLSFLCAVAALLFSPTMILMPIVPTLWLLLGTLFGKVPARRALWTAAGLLVPGAVVAALILHAHHYGALTGWTEISVATISGNLQTATLTLRDVAVSAGPIVAIAYAIVGLAILILVFVPVGAGRRETLGLKPTGTSIKDLLFVFSVPLAVSATSFGAVSINTLFVGRYVFAPWVFGGLALAAVIGKLAYVRPRPTRTLLVAALAVAIVLNLPLQYFGLERQVSSQLAAQRTVSRLISEQVASWPEGAQVLIILPDTFPSWTGGYNHWSTWYLRGLSGRTDLIGVIGSAKAVIRSPFIANYVDHSPEFWYLANGRSARYSMVGLEIDRPLFAYASNGIDETFSPVTVVFSGAGETSIVPPGETPEKMVRPSPEGQSETWPDGYFVWPVPMETPLSLQGETAG